MPDGANPWLQTGSQPSWSTFLRYCNVNAGNFDCHVDAAVRWAHHPKEKIRGFRLVLSLARAVFHGTVTLKKQCVKIMVVLSLKTKAKPTAPPPI